MNSSLKEKLAALGGIVSIGDVIVPIDETELAWLENTLGATFPDDYREFIAAYGSCMFGEYIDFEPIEKLPEPLSSSGNGHFCSFYGADQGRHRSLLKAMHMFHGRMPDSMIPIGDDGGGNQICLGIKGEERGRIYYWDHHNEWDEDDYEEDFGTAMPPEEKWRNLYLVADSFSDFINRLMVSP